jgi:hypothetical protein
MGRGRQKAKQQKIARKLKYLTTDTNYDELAKELSERDSSIEPADPFVQADDSADAEAGVGADAGADAGIDEAAADDIAAAPVVNDDLDEYARWAAEAAAKATSGEFPASSKTLNTPKPVLRKPIPMPKPSTLKPKK